MQGLARMGMRDEGGRAGDLLAPKSRRFRRLSQAGENEIDRGREK